MNPVTSAPLAAAHDMSLLGLFMQADWVVKLVMLALIFASIFVWAIVFEKTQALRRARREADALEDQFWSGGSLDELFRKQGETPQHPLAAVFVSGMREWRRSMENTGAAQFVAGTKERVERAMMVTIQREMERLEKRMTFLANTGSAAPFIGLFGTVWGIMNSFTAIAGMQNTSLAVVAPGIAEALFATAIGLVAAIPAVLAYNMLGSQLAKFASRMEGFAAEFSAILSRQTEQASIRHPTEAL
ncbi:MAG: protein TolQ [Alphaproteobacteria bacterium]|nr:protein TolQ [Alphaproteobacteria bacterium]